MTHRALDALSLSGNSVKVHSTHASLWPEPRSRELAASNGRRSQTKYPINHCGKHASAPLETWSPSTLGP